MKSDGASGRGARDAGEALSSLNAKARRKKNSVAMMEATIEAKAKKRRGREKPVSAGLK